MRTSRPPLPNKLHSHRTQTSLYCRPGLDSVAGKAPAAAHCRPVLLHGAVGLRGPAERPRRRPQSSSSSSSRPRQATELRVSFRLTKGGAAAGPCHCSTARLYVATAEAGVRRSPACMPACRRVGLQPQQNGFLALTDLPGTATTAAATYHRNLRTGACPLQGGAVPIHPTGGLPLRRERHLRRHSRELHCDHCLPG